MAETRPFVLFGIPDFEADGPLPGRLRKAGADVAGTGSSQELLSMARRRAPDVIVLDDALETVGGQVLIRLLRGICPAARIILLMPAGTHPDRAVRQPLVCTLVAPVAGRDLAIVVEAALENRAPAVPAKSAPPVIFCVDDDPLFLKSLVRILSRRGYSVLGYESPEKALEQVPIHQPALVFIDVLMPGMNGLDLASELREEYGDRLPFVLLTAKASDQEIAEGYQRGARYYITKPCEPDRVVNIADYLVGDLGPGERELLQSRL